MNVTDEADEAHVRNADAGVCGEAYEAVASCRSRRRLCWLYYSML